MDKTQLTQISRALQRLCIEHIPSYSPQARGRMERFFGTWQGRLPQELRTAGIKDVEHANRYLHKVFTPWHNRSLTVPAKERGSAFVPRYNIDLDEILSIHHERLVHNDNTVVVRKNAGYRSTEPVEGQLCKCWVIVCEHLDGTISVRYGPRLLGKFHRDGRTIKPPVKRKR